MEGEGILSPRPCPGDELPQACAKSLTLQTSHTDCASFRSLSLETTANNGESTVAGNPKQSCFLPSTALRVYQMGKLILQW